MKIIPLFALLMTFLVTSVQAEVKVGSASVDITPPVGVPLAGYGGIKRRLPFDLLKKHPYAKYFKPSTGIHDPIRSKAFLIQNGNEKLLFVSLDVIGVNFDFYKTVKKAASQFGIKDVFVGATHTHAGPGTLSDSWLFEIMASDVFQEEIYEGFEKGVLKSVELATKNLRPATLHRTKFEAPGIQKNRRKRPGHFDKDAFMLFAKAPDGTSLGGIVNFAVHPIAFGQKNFLFSADLAGGIENELKEIFKTQSEFLFFNGAEGDVSTHADGEEGLIVHSKSFAQAALTASSSAVPVEAKWKVRAKFLKMPKGKLALWACYKKVLGKVFGKARIGVGEKALPRLAEISQIDFGNFVMMTWPGEATTDVGILGKATAQKAGYAEVWTLGLTNGYMGYLVTEDEFNAGGYEVCVAYHGYKGSNALINGHRELFESR